MSFASRPCRRLAFSRFFIGAMLGGVAALVGGPERASAEEVNALAAIRLAHESLNAATDQSVFIIREMSEGEGEKAFRVCDVEYFLLSTELYTVRADVDGLSEAIEAANLIKPAEASADLQGKIGLERQHTQALLSNIQSWRAFCDTQADYAAQVAEQEDMVGKALAEIERLVP